MAGVVKREEPREGEAANAGRGSAREQVEKCLGFFPVGTAEAPAGCGDSGIFHDTGGDRRVAAGTGRVVAGF
jgi:hypothetical protein